MTTTDRRDADDATFAAEMDRLNRLEVADEGAEERVARATLEADRLDIYGDLLCGHGAASSESHRRCRARAAIAELAAPGTAVDNTAAEFHADGDAMTFAVNPPPDSPITVMADDARVLLRINADGTVDGSVEDASEAAGIFVREIRRLIQQPPAPGTDSSGQAVQRVLDLADELDGEKDGFGYQVRNGLKPGPGDRIRAAVAGPQRDHDGEGGQ